MTMTETHVDRNELAEMTPAEFVGLIRTECMNQGGDYHPLVNGLENGSITTPQLQLLSSSIFISKMLPWIGTIYVDSHEDVRTSLVKPRRRMHRI